MGGSNSCARKPKRVERSRSGSADLFPTPTGRGMNALGLGLAAGMGEEENVFISPQSIGVCLGMVLAGATEGSATEAALLGAFGADKDAFLAVQGDLRRILAGARAAEDAGVVLSQVNSIWARADVLTSYKDAMANDFGGLVEPVTTRAPINAYVEQQTHGKVREILEEEIGAEVRAVLVNAVYFKGSWATRFDRADTEEDGVFVSGSGERVRVPMMRKTFGKGTVKYARAVSIGGTKVDALALPYGAEAGAETGTGAAAAAAAARYYGVFLLATDAREDIGKTVREVAYDSATLDRAMRGMRVEMKVETEVVLPRFRVEFGLKSLKDALAERYGLGAAFAAQETNEWGRMTGSQGVYLSDVLHKAVVEVSEEGTEAAGAAAAVMGRGLPGGAGHVFAVDRPFLFGVWDNALAVWAFVGKVARPEGLPPPQEVVGPASP